MLRFSPAADDPPADPNGRTLHQIIDGILLGVGVQGPSHVAGEERKEAPQHLVDCRFVDRATMLKMAQLLDPPGVDAGSTLLMVVGTSAALRRCTRLALKT